MFPGIQVAWKQIGHLQTYNFVKKNFEIYVKLLSNNDSKRGIWRSHTLLGNNSVIIFNIIFFSAVRIAEISMQHVN